MQKVILAFSLMMIGMFSCSPEPTVISSADNPFGILPERAIDPIDNVSTPEKVELGRMLFWDPILSGGKDVACVSCHHPDNDYAEQIDLSRGVGARGLSRGRRGGSLAKRNSMTILNVGFNGIDVDGNYDPANTTAFWDSRSKSLEEQALEPIRSKEEMRGDAFSEELAVDSVVARLNSIDRYRQLFGAAFGESPIREEHLAKAIAAFERSLVAPNSRFDLFARGDDNALTQNELDGLNSFIEAGCNNCHSGPMFSDFELHVISVPENDKLDTPDDGAGNFEFRTGSLRNLTNTGPYFHNGHFATLEEAIEFYDDVEGRDSQNPNVRDRDLDDEIDNLNLPENQVDEIAAFIRALNDPEFDRTILTEVPSGLKAGGDID